MQRVTIPNAQGESQNSLASLLDKCTNELLSVLLEDLIDLVENRVNVFTERLVTLSNAGRLGRSFVYLFGPTLGVLLPASLLCAHVWNLHVHVTAQNSTLVGSTGAGSL